MKRYGVLLVVVALLLSGCGGYGGKKKEGEEGTKTTIAGLTANDHGAKSVSGGKIEVELYDNYFEPTVIEGKPGEKVKLELKNEGKAEHNLTIDAQSVDKDVEVGDEAEVVVTIPKSGELSFFCKYHKRDGMAGALSAG